MSTNRPSPWPSARPTVALNSTVYTASPSLANLFQGGASATGLAPSSASPVPAPSCVQTISPTTTREHPGPEFFQLIIFLSVATLIGAVVQGAAPKQLLRKMPQPVVLMVVFIIGGVAFGSDEFSIGCGLACC
jgi:hypothetical protein